MLTVGIMSQNNWDPLQRPNGTEVTPSPQCLYRIKRDLSSFFKDPPHGIYIVPDESDILTVHALIVGNDHTPYEGGYFYFVLRCPADYPLSPPKVRLMTTGAGTVRFNPNLYKCGKVCLSMLGTWVGPAWSAAQSIMSVLISIQTLFNEMPFFNEPGALEDKPGDADEYNNIIRHETVRVAVCGMVTNVTGLAIPPKLYSIVKERFLTKFKFYEQIALNNFEVTGRPMKNPLYPGLSEGTYQYEEILKQLHDIRKRLLTKEGLQK